jgi:hypothetical protein
MSSTNRKSAADGTPTYLVSGDPNRKITDFAFHETTAGAYVPVWLNDLADDVTLEGSLMNGAVKGPDAVREILGFIRTLYQDQRINFAGQYNDDSYLEDYNATVCGEPIGAFVRVARNPAGQAQHIAAGYRPRKSLLLLSQAVGEHFAGTPFSEYFPTGGDEA